MRSKTTPVKELTYQRLQKLASEHHIPILVALAPSPPHSLLHLVVKKPAALQQGLLQLAFQQVQHTDLVQTLGSASALGFHPFRTMAGLDNSQCKW